MKFLVFSLVLCVCALVIAAQSETFPDMPEDDTPSEISTDAVEGRHRPYGMYGGYGSYGGYSGYRPYGGYGGYRPYGVYGGMRPYGGFRPYRPFGGYAG